MKKNKTLLMLFIALFSMSAYAQTREIYVNDDFRTLAKDHKTVAIIPFKTIIKLRPKQMEKMTPEQFASGITVGEVEGMRTSTRKRERLPLRNGAVFRTPLRPGKSGQTSEPPHFTKCGQELLHVQIRGDDSRHSTA